MPFSEKKWLIAEPEESLVEKLLKELPGLSPITAEILVNRGLVDKQQVDSFLSISLQDLHNPFLLQDMEIAVKRIVEAIKKEEKILVYGDYDADGITSTTLLFSTLEKLGGRVQYYLPHRLEEGYGLHQKALSKSREKGVDLIITVDCGISAHQEILFAGELGIDVIVTDHHHPGETLPTALAVINPKRSDCSYPFKELAGVGVAYKLAEALISHLGEGEEILPSLLELVAIGTIADIVPLVYENRILVKHGLDALQETTRLGLLALKEVAGLEEGDFNPYSIGFAISPRLNALGRLCSSNLPPAMEEKLGRSPCFTTVEGPNAVCLGVELLQSSCLEEAKDIAVFLNEENKRRQELEGQITEKALALLEEQWDAQKEKVIILGSEDWHLGVIGIVASRLVERYYRPVIILNFNDGKAKGSARSIRGFHLFDALQECSELLEKYGGHELAAGLTLKQENLVAFKEKINSLAEKRLSQEALIPSLNIEVDQINLDNLSFETLEQLEGLAPYGCGNPRPILVCRNARLLEYRAVGNNGNHLKIKAATGQTSLDGIGFNLGPHSLELDSNKRYDLAFVLDRNEWKGRVSLQLKLEDLKEKFLAKESQFLGKENNIPANQDFCYTEVVGNKDEEKQRALENLSLGEIIFFKLDTKNKVVRVENSKGDSLGFLNNRLERKLRPYLRAGVEIFPWVVALDKDRLKIAFSLVEGKTGTKLGKRKIFLYYSPLETIWSYQQTQNREGIALGHGALSLWEAAKVLAFWRAGWLETLLLSQEFYQAYQIPLLENVENVEIKEMAEFLPSKEDLSSVQKNWLELVPSREFLAGLYRGLKAKIPQGSEDKTVFISLDLEEIRESLFSQGLNVDSNRRVWAGLDTLEEMNLLERELDGEKHYIYRLPTPKGKFVLDTLLRYREDLRVKEILEKSQ